VERVIAKIRGERSNRCRDMTIFQVFSTRRPFAILDLLSYAYRDNGEDHLATFGGVHHCSKFVWNGSSIGLVSMTRKF